MVNFGELYGICSAEALPQSNISGEATALLTTAELILN